MLNGSVLRVDPATGAARAGQPAASAASDANEQRIIGYGFRNPFRMIVKPGTNDVWIADVGWNTWEEINRIPDLTTRPQLRLAVLRGQRPRSTRASNICPTQAADDGARSSPTTTAPRSCRATAAPTGSSSVAGHGVLRRAPATTRRTTRTRSSSRTTRASACGSCSRTAAAIPNPADARAFASSAAGPVDLQIGPDGNLYYVDFDGGQIMRVKYGLAAVATRQPDLGRRAR